MCVHACMCLQTLYTCVFICVYSCIFPHLCSCMFIFLRTFLHIQMCIFICLFTCIHEQNTPNMYVYILRTYVCVHLHPYTCQHARTYIVHKSKKNVTSQRWYKQFNPLQRTATQLKTVATHCHTPTCVCVIHRFKEICHHDCANSSTPLQHSATLCNTLQHTATLCNTLQRSATLCNTLQHSATHALENSYLALLSLPLTHMHP